MVDIDPLYELVQLVTDFLPILLIIFVVLFFVGLLFKMLGSDSNSKLRIDKKMRFVVPMLLILFTLGSISAQGNVNAVGISYDSPPINATLMTVRLTGLTVNNEYTIYASSNTATFTNVTITASSATEFVPLPVLDETDGYYLNVVQSTGGANINTTATTGQNANVWVAPRDAGGLLPTGAFFDLMVPIILIVIVAGIVIGFTKGSTGGRGRKK